MVLSSCVMSTFPQHTWRYGNGSIQIEGDKRCSPSLRAPTPNSMPSAGTGSFYTTRRHQALPNTPEPCRSTSLPRQGERRMAYGNRDFILFSPAPQLRRLSYTETAKPWTFRLPYSSLFEFTCDSFFFDLLKSASFLTEHVRSRGLGIGVTCSFTQTPSLIAISGLCG
jgi:hypothetical protein